MDPLAYEFGITYLCFSTKMAVGTKVMSARERLLDFVWFSRGG